MRATAERVLVRQFRDEDLHPVLHLLSASLGSGPAGERSVEFFRWKHLANPFGRSAMWVAELDGSLVGFRAFMRWRFTANGSRLEAVRAVDTATDPSHQRLGIFTRLTRGALEELRGEVDLIFNTPNEKSLPGYLKMGWVVAGAFPVSLRIRRPVRFIRRYVRGPHDECPVLQPASIEAETASEGLSDPRLAGLIERTAHADGLLSTNWDPETLRWRFAAAPSLDYRTIRMEDGDDLRGIAVFRVHKRRALDEALVSQILVRPDDRACVRWLLRQVRRAAAVDHIACVFPSTMRSGAWLASTGFVRAPGGMTLTVRPLRDGILPDPTSIRSWSMSLAELEVF